MQCEEIKELLTAYQDNELTAEERRNVEEHLTVCPDCRKELESIITLQSKLRQFYKTKSQEITSPSDAWQQIKSKAKISDHKEKPLRPRFHPSLIGVPLIIVLFVVLIIGMLPNLGGKSPPPPEAPAIISDGEGGAYIFWHETPSMLGSGMYAQHVDSSGNQLWGEKGKFIDSAVTIPRTVNDGENGAVVAWTNREDVIIVRKYDFNGNLIWETEDYSDSGGLIDIIADGTGSTVILKSTGETSLYAQNINAKGEKLWGDRGVFIGTIDDYIQVSCAADVQGNTVIAWQEENNRDITLYAQKISEDGTVLWEEKGKEIISAIDGYRIHLQIISDNAGNFFITWEAGNAPDNDIYLQKLDKDGNLLWKEDGLRVCQHHEQELLQTSNMREQPQMVSDGEGGVIITWHDRRRILNREIFAQRINADGDILWDEYGVPVWNLSEQTIGTTSGILDSDIVSDGESGAIIIWTGYDHSYMNKIIIFAQKLNQDGQRMWSSEIVYDSTTLKSQGYSNTVGDGAGGIIIASRVSHGNSVSRTDSVYVQKITADGERQWGDAGIGIDVKRSNPILPVTAAISVIAAAAIIYGILRRNKTALVFSAIAPVAIGIAGMFSLLLLTGLLIHSYQWAYVLSTPLNSISAAVIPATGLIVAVMGIIKKTVTKWIIIPVLVFSALSTCFIELISFSSFL
jgi:hypothetical protein